MLAKNFTVMPYRNRNFKRPIQSVKHIVDIQGAVGIDTKEENTLVLGVDAPVVTTVEEVQKGCRVSAFYLNVQVVATSDAALHNVYMILYKNPANLITPGSVPNANVQGQVAFKKFVFHTEMRMGSDAGDSIPITLFNGVIKIPRQYQTQRLNDTIKIQLYSPGVTWEYCIQCIYKEYQ